MSLTTDLEIKHIKEYAELLNKIYDLQMRLEWYRDKLSNLASYMSQEDINEANLVLKRMHEKDDIWND